MVPVPGIKRYQAEVKSMVPNAQVKRYHTAKT
jgi:hypothetical protein